MTWGSQVTYLWLWPSYLLLLLLKSTIVTGKIYCSRPTNALLFCVKMCLNKAKKNVTRVKSAIDLDVTAYHGYDDFTLDMTATAIDMMPAIPMFLIIQIFSFSLIVVVISIFTILLLKSNTFYTLHLYNSTLVPFFIKNS